MSDYDLNLRACIRVQFCRAEVVGEPCWCERDIRMKETENEDMIAISAPWPQIEHTQE